MGIVKGANKIMGPPSQYGFTKARGASGPVAWKPSDEPLNVWFRMDKTSGSGGGLTLLDQGPNHYNATVAGGTPSIVSNVINGQPVLRLVAPNDYLQFAGTTPTMPIGAPSIVVIVAKGAALTSGNFATVAAFATQAGAYEGFLNINSAGYSDMFWGGGNGVATTYAGINTFDYSSAFYGLVVAYTGAGDFSNPSNFSALNNNVTQTVSATGASSTASTKSLIGAWPDALGSLNYTGDIAEIIIFNRTPDSTFLSNLHGYLNTKFGPGVG